MIRLARVPPWIPITSFGLRSATPVLPVAIGRPGSSPSRSIPKQPFQQTAGAEISIASDARTLHTSRGFLPWRFAYAGPRCTPRHLHGASIRKPSQKRTKIGLTPPGKSVIYFAIGTRGRWLDGKSRSPIMSDENARCFPICWKSQNATTTSRRTMERLGAFLYLRSVSAARRPSLFGMTRFALQSPPVNRRSREPALVTHSGRVAL